MSSQKFPTGSDLHYITNLVMGHYGVQRDTVHLYAVLLFIDMQFYAEYGSSASGITWCKTAESEIPKPESAISYNPEMLSDLAVSDAVLDELNWIFTTFTLAEIVEIVSGMSISLNEYSAKTAYTFDSSQIGQERTKSALIVEAEHRFLEKLLGDTSKALSLLNS